MISTKRLPMEPGFFGFVSDPLNLSARAGRPFLRVVFILLMMALASCSSTKKLKQSHSEKESSIDKTESSTTKVSSVVTIEKVDTVLHIDADTTGISYFVPWLQGDTSTSYQEAENANRKNYCNYQTNCERHRPADQQPGNGNCN